MVCEEWRMMGLADACGIGKCMRDVGLGFFDDDKLIFRFAGMLGLGYK